MQKPELMSKLQEVMANPSKMMEYQSDPDFAALMGLMFSMMQK